MEVTSFHDLVYWVVLQFSHPSLPNWINMNEKQRFDKTEPPHFQWSDTRDITRLAQSWGFAVIKATSQQTKQKIVRGALMQVAGNEMA